MAIKTILAYIVLLYKYLRTTTFTDCEDEMVTEETGVVRKNQRESEAIEPKKGELNVM